MDIQWERMRTASIALRRSAAVSVYRAIVRDARLRRAPHHEGLCVLDSDKSGTECREGC